MMKLRYLILIAVFANGLRSSAQNTVAIEGAVYQIGTSIPVRGARVVLRVGSQIARFTTTDSLGFFRFAELNRENYEVDIEADGFSWVRAASAFIDVRATGNISGLKYEMRATGTISGRVYDEERSAIVNARVDVMSARYLDGRVTLQSVSTVQTDDRGEFRAFNLNAGAYYLRAHIESKNPKTYPDTYYPNATDPSQARKLQVDQGREISGADIEMTAGGVRISGQFVDPKAGQNAYLLRPALFLIPRNPSIFVLPGPAPTAFPGPEGNFQITGVLPGSYNLFALLPRAPTSNTGLRWARTIVEVGSDDVKDIKISPPEPITIRGRYILDSPTADAVDLSSGDTMTAVSAEASPRFFSMSRARRNAAGEFVFQGMSPGRFFFKDVGFGVRGFLVSLLYNGQDVTRNGFDVEPGVDGVLEVHLSKESGEVTGEVRDRLGKTVRASVVLLPERELRANPLIEVRMEKAFGEDGRFTVKNVRPGEYTLIAFPDDERFSSVDLQITAFVEQFERFGQRIDIRSGQTAAANAVLIPEEN